MNLSMKWLKDFVDVNSTPHEYAAALTMSGSKVEGYKIEGSEIDKVVVGKVVSINKHPDADKLLVCMLDIGTATIQIVTGAQNLTIGDIVPVALDGSTLPNGIKIKKGKLRGIESNGMLCSIAELQVTKSDFPNACEDGIFVLEEDCTLGQDIKEAIGLNDTTVEFEITSNRPDCLSVIGLARETAVTFGLPLKLHTPVVKEADGNIGEILTAKIDAPNLCSRYMARVVKNVKIEPAPRFIRERLRASGIRPINNIVDITNYVMLEYGQPMHAFDKRYIEDNSIIVRTAKANETITTLDGGERKLSENMLVIADSKKPMAVAGVMGGEYSGIMADTNTIVFESACFNGASIRTTARDLGMRTDSSGRFEKGLDPQNCEMALERACELVELLGAGEVVCGKIDCDYSETTLRKIKLNADFINKFLGINITREEMEKILTSLSFVIEGENVIVPSFRNDVQHKADIAEEIARIFGYNNIETTEIRGSAQGKLTDEQKFLRKINDTLIAQGYSEIITYSFISPKYYDKILMPQDSILRNSVKISNPLGEDTSIMRTTALPSMLEALSKNYSSRNLTAKLFEVATEYIPNGENELPQENLKVVIGAYGKNVDFFSVKGAVERLLTSLSVKACDVEAIADLPHYHPGRTAKLTIDNETLGFIGEIHPDVIENYELGLKTYVATLSVPVMEMFSVTDKLYHPIPRFPSTTRDLAIICDISLPVQSIEKIIKGSAGKLLKEISLFDVYEGAQIETGKKSVAYSITLRADDRTLTDEEANNAVSKIIKGLSAVGAFIRS